VRGLPTGTEVGPHVVIEEEVDGHRLRVSMGSFFQSGPQAAALLVDAVTRAAPELQGAGVVVDAYAGVGMFSVCAVDPRSRVVAIETSPTPCTTSPIGTPRWFAARSAGGARRPGWPSTW
jgi:23S rRNA (uracil1939-C5)-methyltransferase